MAGYTKLFSSITTSSVWCESDKTLRIWVAMMAHADAQGKVEGSIPGMANVCRMGLKTFEKHLAPLLEPDGYSRSPKDDGRRLRPCPGGWELVNHGEYRDRYQDKPGSRAAYMRGRRRAQKLAPTDGKGNALQSNVTRNTNYRRQLQLQTKNNNTPPTPPSGGASQSPKVEKGGRGRSRSGQNRAQGAAQRLKCPDCGTEAVIRKKASYGAGWVCWRRHKGCGHEFELWAGVILAQLSEADRRALRAEADRLAGRGEACPELPMNAEAEKAWGAILERLKAEGMERHRWATFFRPCRGVMLQPKDEGADLVVMAASESMADWLQKAHRLDAEKAAEDCGLPLTAVHFVPPGWRPAGYPA